MGIFGSKSKKKSTNKKTNDSANNTSNTTQNLPIPQVSSNHPTQEPQSRQPESINSNNAVFLFEYDEILYFFSIHFLFALKEVIERLLLYL
jgi:hypothetical protein